jgi:integrase
MAHHSFLDGRVHVYKRENSRYWQCSAFIADKNHRTSTREDSLAKAKDFAEDWYLELRGMHKRGEIVKNEKTFQQAADLFLREYEIITEGDRNPIYVEGHGIRLRAYLLPFFGKKGLSEIMPGTLQEYRIYRREIAMKKWKKPPARNTIHQEIVTLRQVLKTAYRHRWITHLPDLSEPYKTKGKLSRRAWFSPEEYKRLYEATGERAKNPKRNRWSWECEQLHDYVLLMANTGLRPDEAARLEFRDVQIVDDAATRETILEIDVRGKRGVGYCKSMPGAVYPLKRLRKRNIEHRNQQAEAAARKEGLTTWQRFTEPAPTDRLFPKKHNELFNNILDELELKTDRDGKRRTAYSLRHTYICMRLMEGADIYQVAKNCRTSVEMIQKNYAAHIKTMIDASALNVRKPKPRRKAKKRKVVVK